MTHVLIKESCKAIRLTLLDGLVRLVGDSADGANKLIARRENLDRA
jgi:hypothetical protein